MNIQLNKTYPVASLLIFCFLFSLQLNATTPDETPRKHTRAVKFNSYELKLDGKLDDAVWKNAIFVSDFLQKEPDQGASPTVKTEVAIVYDEKAIYIGARMYCENPGALRMHLDRHDVQNQSEQLIVALDTYLDRRTAYVFGVNTAGVRFDRYHYEDSESTRDFSFDPVWNAKTAVDEKGWTAEMRIPFSQLRFNSIDKQVWGVNFNRWIPAKNEDIYWIYTPRDETGYASRFGNLEGIEKIKPSRRIEVLPYAASDGRMLDGVNPSNPFSDGSDLGYRLGADAKMGLGPSLTLNATFNPDFGQVEADPAEVNLSAFETFFSERRPFFTEGRQLFSANGPRYFYSRRIGGSPHGFASGDFVDSPINTSILNATKVTGRLKSGLSIGALGAVTEREYATSYDTATGINTTTEIEPMTLWGVTRVMQEIGKNESTAGIILTGVKRDLDDSDPLAESLHKQAISGGGDFLWRFGGGGMYQLRGFTGFSHVTGTKESILNTQQKSARYFQRPDADYVSIDSNRTSLTGFTSQVEIRKRSGKHWLWGLGAGSESPDFELNDMGTLSSADDIDSWVWLNYRETQPGNLFRNYQLEVSASTGWNHGGIRTFSNISFYSNATWHNFMNTWLSLNFQLGGQSDNRTRGGPLMWFERGWSLNAGINSNWASTTRYNVGGTYAVDELDGYYYSINGSLTTRVGTRWEFSLSPRYVREDQPRQWVTLSDQNGGPTETFGKRYAFSRIKKSTLSMQIRMNYFFTPDLSLEVYAEPFASAGDYYQHGELTAARTTDIRLYDNIDYNSNGELEVTDGGQTFLILDDDFGFRSFRSNAVLRWRFNPGSTIYLVWQRNLSASRDPGQTVKAGSLFDSFGTAGTDFLALKIAYWIPIS